MEETTTLKPNNKEFVILSLDRYKKLANIDEGCENLYWATDINSEIPIKYKLQPDSDEMPLLPKTIPQLLYENVKHYPDLPSFHSEVKPGVWRYHTWKECWEISMNFAKALVAFGITHRSSVNIIGFN